MLFLMACHDVSIGNPCDAGFVLSEPSLYTYSLVIVNKNGQEGSLSKNCSRNVLKRQIKGKRHFTFQFQKYIC